MCEEGGKSSYLHLGVSLLGEPRQLQPHVVVLVHHLGAQGGTLSLHSLLKNKTEQDKRTNRLFLFFEKCRFVFVVIVLLLFVVLLCLDEPSSEVTIERKWQRLREGEAD